jgi:hypothetical protein
MINCRKKKSLTAKSNIINSQKWLSTSNEDKIYTCLEYKTTNRSVKDELVNEMKQWNVNPTVFTKFITLKNTGETIKTYIISASFQEFQKVYSHIEAKKTAATFA